MKRTDIHSILIIGAGPIIIGQACEFDYSGVQACKALRREGYRVILVNSNPATIMTDPEFADATYIEPLTAEMLDKILAHEKPDAILPTVGGQTALNLAMELHRKGILTKHNVALLGARPETIDVAEDRQKFKVAMEAAGLKCPQSGIAHSVEQAELIAKEVGLPLLIRPSFTLGGSGGGIVYTQEEFRAKVEHGLRESPVHEVLIEQSVLGWKEYELEVMRDKADNFVVVCSIENLDPMGVHTGDSITVAPAQTLTDKEYQRLRNQARIVMRTVGVETGGSNVQFAVNPANGDVLVIEMNPRVSRSSALASKATGFPIAKFAALLAVGYTLDEIKNDITRVTPASFEPSIDYCVVKMPRWAFEKFPGADPVLGPQMKSVGEVMAIGRTFAEALNKACRGLEIGADGFGGPIKQTPPPMEQATAFRIFGVAEALRNGATLEEICARTQFDPWFVQQMIDMLKAEQRVADGRWQLAGSTLQIGSATEDDGRKTTELLRGAKRMGISDSQIARAINKQLATAQLTSATGHRPLTTAFAVRALRLKYGIKANYYRVDTCAAEFEAHTPYLYSHYERLDEAEPTHNKKVIVIGGGPNRIGQGIEFDYCCVHACMALKEMGFETIMVNCNPETVSTDYDTADRLYFEPLTVEDVLNVIDEEQPVGVIVQFGGQTPLNLTKGLVAGGAPIWGTSPDSIDIAEDRIRFGELLRELEIPGPPWGSATSLDEARAVAERIGYPVLVRPSYVIGGRAMEIAHNDDQLATYLAAAALVSDGAPVLIDKYLEDSFEVDVDALCDGENCTVAGVMEHIEEAGIHSGDSACVMPPYKITLYHYNQLEDYTIRLAQALKVKGLVNVQYAIKDEVVYVLEVNPRASRTVPYVSKAIGKPLAKYAAQIQAGKTLEDLGFTETPDLKGFHVKEVVLPFKKFPGADYRLGPEMKSTGEVMASASSFGMAFAKAQAAAGSPLPTSGAVLITVNDNDKAAAMKIAKDFHRLGFKIYATQGTTRALQSVNVPAEMVGKMADGSSTIEDLIKSKGVQIVINTPLGAGARDDSRVMRTLSVLYGVPLLTTLSAAQAAVLAIQALNKGPMQAQSLQARFAAG